MKNLIFIPNIIKVGYQARQGTYTGQLAYIIYYDSHNKLRKEYSWNNWRHKDIEPQEFDNTPTEGFVLNKKAGGGYSHWNRRATYCRVYDPRGFEFEISIDNLLYILENTDCIRGKGLAGEFVYGWSGKDLLLMPTSAPDYAEVKSVSDSVNTGTWLKGKDLTLGGTYLTNKGEHWVYLGRFDLWSTHWNKNKDTKNKGKHYFFSNGVEKFDLVTTKSLTRRVISIVDSDPVFNYAGLMDSLECCREFSPVERYELVPYSKKVISGFGWYELQYKVVVNSKDSRLQASRYNGKYYIESYRVYSGYNARQTEGLTLDELFIQYSLYKTVYYLANGKQLKE